MDKESAGHPKLQERVLGLIEGMRLEKFEKKQSCKLKTNKGVTQMSSVKSTVRSTVKSNIQFPQVSAGVAPFNPTVDQPFAPADSFIAVKQSPGLSIRETEVLKHLCNGMTNKQVAATMKLSVKTIDAHRNHIMIKLRIHNLAGLTKFAIRENVVSVFTHGQFDVS